MIGGGVLPRFTVRVWMNVNVLIPHTDTSRTCVAIYLKRFPFHIYRSEREIEKERKNVKERRRCRFCSATDWHLCTVVRPSRPLPILYE